MLAGFIGGPAVAVWLGKHSKTYRRRVLLAASVVVLVFLLPSLINLSYIGWLLGNNIVHQYEWEKKGSPSYVITADEVSLRDTAGVSVSTVKNGVSESVVIGKNQYPGDEIYTIDRLFRWADWCVSKYPGLICTISYDAQFGYPTYVKVDCTEPPDACMDAYLTITVLEVRMLH